MHLELKGPFRFALHAGCGEQAMSMCACEAMNAMQSGIAPDLQACGWEKLVS